ncbi:hypothetical protein BT63DRAFT_292500 [Microthyrium microscopicum]|uniref:Uncharacterized protein n=1 Tax=Microthyrium microscopicum TaxID=703497 RepID=A0A6A6U8K9_9PEZI|nr:hypothetical protein BT63DRAFT_292500 [Microthyrium microscopicum]
MKLVMSMLLNLITFGASNSFAVSMIDVPPSNFPNFASLVAQLHLIHYLRQRRRWYLLKPASSFLSFSIQFLPRQKSPSIHLLSISENLKHTMQ